MPFFGFFSFTVLRQFTPGYLHTRQYFPLLSQSNENFYRNDLKKVPKNERKILKIIIFSHQIRIIMKKVAFLLCLILSINSFSLSFAQVLTVNDLYLLNESHDLTLIEYYLTNHKGFSYKGLVAIDKYGWDYYQFINNNDTLEVGIGSGMNSDVKQETIQILYYIGDKTEYNTFIESLNFEGFMKFKEEILKNGVHMLFYKNDEKYRIIIISEKVDSYLVQLL